MLSNLPIIVNKKLGMLIMKFIKTIFVPRKLSWKLYSQKYEEYLSSKSSIIECLTLQKFSYGKSMHVGILCPIVQ